MGQSNKALGLFFFAYFRLVIAGCFPKVFNAKHESSFLLIKILTKLFLNKHALTVKQLYLISFVPDTVNNNAFNTLTQKRTIIFNYKTKFLPSIAFEGMFTVLFFFINFLLKQKKIHIQLIIGFRCIVPLHILILVTRVYEWQISHQNPELTVGDIPQLEQK